MNRAQKEKRAFLDYRGRDLLVLKRVIMRYKTTVPAITPDSLSSLLRRAARVFVTAARDKTRLLATLSTCRAVINGAVL